MSKTPPSDGTAKPPIAVAPPTGNPRFPLFDAARAIAALSVLVFHGALVTASLQKPILGPILTELKVGVAVFFAISGFLLYRPFILGRLGGRPRRRLRDYSRARLIRIVPAYWVALTLLSLWPGLRDLFSDRTPIYYLFGQVYWKATRYNGLVPAWTLCVEVSFYAFLPVYAAVLRLVPARSQRSIVAREFAIAVMLGLLGIVLRGFLPWHAIALSLPGTLDWFAVGMSLAALSVGVDSQVISSKLGAVLEEVARFSWLGAAALLVACAILEHRHISPLLVHELYAAIALAFVLPACSFHRYNTTRMTWSQRVLGIRLLAWLGLISYGIYLWHWRTMYYVEGVAVGWHLSGVTFIVVTFITFIIATTCAAASYYFIERPLLEFKSVRRNSR